MVDLVVGISKHTFCFYSIEPRFSELAINIVYDLLYEEDKKWVDGCNKFVDDLLYVSYKPFSSNGEMPLHEPNINLDVRYLNKKMLKETLTPFIDCVFINQINREMARKILYENS